MRVCFASPQRAPTVSSIVELADLELTPATKQFVDRKSSSVRGQIAELESILETAYRDTIVDDEVVSSRVVDTMADVGDLVRRVQEALHTYGEFDTAVQAEEFVDGVRQSQQHLRVATEETASLVGDSNFRTQRLEEADSLLRHIAAELEAQLEPAKELFRVLTSLEAYATDIETRIEELQNDSDIDLAEFTREHLNVIEDLNYHVNQLGESDLISPGIVAQAKLSAQRVEDELVASLERAHENTQTAQQEVVAPGRVSLPQLAARVHTPQRGHDINGH